MKSNNENRVINHEVTHPMNMPYISLLTAFKVIDKIVQEYKDMADAGRTPEERQVGRAGLTATLKIKRGLLEEVKRRERSFD